VSLSGLYLRGRLVIEGGSCEVTNCTFEGERSVDGDGGAVAVSAGNLMVADSVFRSNRAVGNGGAVHVEGGQASFDACSFTSNTAGGQGGALHVSGGVVSLGRGSLLQGNSAINGGSSIRVRGGIVTYTLPAPLGRWIYSSSSYQIITGAVDSEYPFPCTSLRVCHAHICLAEAADIAMSPTFLCHRFPRTLWQQ
jgi:predicted outer membrane repeat protein